MGNKPRTKQGETAVVTPEIEAAWQEAIPLIMDRPNEWLITSDIFPGRSKAATQKRAALCVLFDLGTPRQAGFELQVDSRGVWQVRYKPSVSRDAPTVQSKPGLFAQEVLVPAELDDGRLVEEINSEHGSAMRFGELTVESAARCGDYLLEAKRRCKHGEWMGWVESHCEFDHGQACRYMQVANFARAQSLDGMTSVRECLRMVGEERRADVEADEADEAAEMPEEKPSPAATASDSPNGRVKNPEPIEAADARRLPDCQVASRDEPDDEPDEGYLYDAVDGPTHRFKQRVLEWCDIQRDNFPDLPAIQMAAALEAAASVVVGW